MLIHQKDLILTNILWRKINKLNLFYQNKSDDQPEENNNLKINNTSSLERSINCPKISKNKNIKYLHSLLTKT
jgi:hypothetical protein